MAPALEELAKQRLNIIICGPTGSGKTSLMKSFLSLWSNSCENDSPEHVAVIEDLAELEHVGKFSTHLIATSECPSDGQSIKKLPRSMLQFCRYLLRMRPERIVVGEIRSDEVVPLVLNLNTGNRGFLASLHANSALDAIDRLQTLFALYSDSANLKSEIVRSLIVRSLDYIIFIDKRQIRHIIHLRGLKRKDLSNTY